MGAHSSAPVRWQRQLATAWQRVCVWHKLSVRMGVQPVCTAQPSLMRA